MKLSHTQKELFLVSPRAWYNKYVLGYQEEVMGSPLFFGSIVEDGVNVLLKGGSLEDAHKLFENNFKRYKVNGKWEDLATSNKVRYSKADWQEHLFTERELETLETKTQQFRTHQSLLRSGKRMIEEFHLNIQPHIKKVLAMQEYFSIPNDHGDEIIGYVDLVCEWEDDSVIIHDVKTSGSAYKANAVLTEDKGKQTALYYEALSDKYNPDFAGFLVLEKKVRKRDPQMRSQILIDVPPDELIEKTFDEFDEVLHTIRKAYFPCCSPQCDQYGQQCAYKQFCKSEGMNIEGLVNTKGKR